MTTKRKATRTRTKVVKAWGGFERGELVFQEGCDEDDGIGESHSSPAIYSLKKDALKRWQDTRQVTIIVPIVAPTKGKRK